MVSPLWIPVGGACGLLQCAVCLTPYAQHDAEGRAAHEHSADHLSKVQRWEPQSNRADWLQCTVCEKVTAARVNKGVRRDHVLSNKHVIKLLAERNQQGAAAAAAAAPKPGTEMTAAAAGGSAAAESSAAPKAKSKATPRPATAFHAAAPAVALAGGSTIQQLSRQPLAKAAKKQQQKQRAATASVHDPHLAQERWDAIYAEQLEQLLENSADLLASRRAVLAHETAVAIVQTQTVRAAQLSALELLPTAVLCSELLAQLDAVALLQVGRASRTLWAAVALRPETWRNTRPLPQFIFSAGTAQAEERAASYSSSRVYAHDYGHAAAAAAQQSWVKSAGSRSPPGVWSLLARHGLVLRWPATNQKNETALQELADVLACVPLPPILDAHGQQISLAPAGFSLDFGEAKDTYGQFHSACSIAQLLPGLLSSQLLSGVSELYLDGLLGPSHLPSWYPLSAQSMELLTQLPLLHTLSVADRNRTPTRASSLLRHLGHMSALTALAFTGYMPRAGSAHAEHLAACSTLRILHLHILRASDAEDCCTVWTLELPQQLEQLAVDTRAVSQLYGYGARPSHGVLDFTTRGQPHTSSSTVTSSSAAAAASPSTASGSALSVTASVSLAFSVLHLVDFVWPSLSSGSGSGTLASLVSALAAMPKLRQLHVHLAEQQRPFAHKLMARQLQVAARFRPDAQLQQHEVAVCLQRLLAGTAPHLHVHVYFANDWSSSSAAALCFPCEAEEAAALVASAASSRRTRGRLHVWDSVLPGGRRAVLRSSQQVCGPAAWGRRSIQQRRDRHMLAMRDSEDQHTQQEYAMYLEQVLRRNAERDRWQVRESYETHHQELIADCATPLAGGAAASAAEAPAAADELVVRLELLLSPELLTAGVSSSKEMCVGGVVLLSRLHRLASDLSDLPAEAFALRLEDSVPFSVSDAGVPISALVPRNVRSITLRQVLRKGHLHLRFEPVTSAALTTAATVQLRPTSAAASSYGVRSSSVTLGSHAVMGAMMGAFSVGGGSYDAVSPSSSYLHSGSSAQRCGFGGGHGAAASSAATSAAAASPGWSTHPQVEQVVRSLYKYTGCTRQLDVLEEPAHTELVAAALHRMLPTERRRAERVSVLLQCLCADGFLSSTSILRGIRSARAQANLLQRTATHRYLLEDGLVENFHLLLNELVEQLRGAHASIFGWSDEQVAELLGGAEEVVFPSVKKNQIHAGISKESKLRAQQRKWAAYDELDTAAKQVKSSANAILHLDSAFEGFSAPAADAIAAPVSANPEQMQQLLSAYSNVGTMPLDTVKLLHSILLKLTNATAADGDKFRRIKLPAPKVQQLLVAVDGALQLLETVGFQRDIEPGYLVLPADSALDHLVRVAQQLLAPGLCLALAGTAAALSTVTAGPAVPGAAAAGDIAPVVTATHTDTASASSNTASDSEP